MKSTTSASTTRPISPSHAPRRRSSVADHNSSLDDLSSGDYDPPRRRSSAFLEVGLGGDDPIVDAKLRRESRPRLSVRFRSKVDVVEAEAIDDCDTPGSPPLTQRDMPFFFPTLPRLLFVVLVIVLIVPSLHTSPLLQVDANPVPPFTDRLSRALPQPEKRADTSTNICKRWSQQSALVNGTLYLYSGRSTTSADQTADTWSVYSRGPFLPPT